MSQQTPHSNFIRLLPAETHTQSGQVSPPTNKTSEHRCTSCAQKEAASSESQDRKQSRNEPSHEAVDHKNDGIPSLNLPEMFSQSSQHPTEKMEEGGERPILGQWSVPHAHENQKHAWYSSMLGIQGKVKDEWGFSSASASRSHTPTPTKIC
ncbi:hypothetical protein yc1106_05381 [Curvularia clavata]|uniref:Uncharacterized protein n=1 Tax=Curvularia clavata TaxID=95742 RepID=A0A9Q8Z9L1_CURCL|nr:hypothetical protein yc1106_05381 [Curvularia clavata]